MYLFSKYLSKLRAEYKKYQNNRINETIKSYSENSEDFYFIQIGSNDGKTGDPIYSLIINYKWKGILIEPIPYIFQRLKNTYKKTTGLIFVNLAIGDKNEFKLMHHIERKKHPNDPYWYDQLASFKKEVVLKHQNSIPNFTKRLKTTRVKCITFVTLIKKYSVKKIDLLHIDTEGFDYEIIKMIKFNKLAPKLILFEHTHLTNTDTQNCQLFLKSNGYKIIKGESDTLAIKINSY